ncbi:MAG: DegT/DnrJ/EryC1/StrS aminotransferase family protein [Chrysiogenales bacterium]|nr:MAG: DegT/DnrJ/EryC1/StrS aminotransferase family protein [Chrysiogenales bacterium]
MKIVSNRPTITRKELEAVLDCLINDELVAGESVKLFENSIAKMIGLKHSLATSSPTAAYHLIFKALEIGESDEVIIPTFFPQAPLSALSLTGGRAVLLDNDTNSLFPSAEKIKAMITPNTMAVVTGDLFGFHADRGALADLGVPVIEDISHSIGTEVNDIPSGKNGTFAVASFDPAGIITTGNGGMVLTNNSKHYSVMKELRGNGRERLHFDCTMTDFQGSMGISQIAKLPDLIARRREIARIYHESLRVTSHAAPFHYSDQFAYQSFPVLFDATIEKIETYWKKAKIEMLRSIGHPLHHLLGLNGSDYPNAERFSKKLYSVPLYPTLSRRDVEKISSSLAGFI